MKKIRLFMGRQAKHTVMIAGGLIALLSSAFLVPRGDHLKVKPVPNIGNNSFAVLELFTSEGCSSCPAADKLLARIQKEAGNKPVYVLAYHVDYWDRLGWKDVFSNAKFTERQYAYSRQFGGQVYTPQVVINGNAECVGSDETAINNGIENVLSKPVATKLVLNVQQASGGADIQYHINGGVGKEQLLVAVVQKQAVSKVMRGENEGRTLTHVQIVQQLYTFNPKTAEGTQHVSLPGRFNARDHEIIGMLQNPGTFSITAATRATFN